MILKNRILAKSGPRKKDNKVLHYRFDSTKIDDYALTWTHPPGNELDKATVIGHFMNVQLKKGDLVGDIFIDESKLSTDQWHYLWDHPDVSIGYEYSLTEQDGITYQDIHKINHVAIGIEEGVCSTPECGLSTQADSKISILQSKGVLQMSDGPLEKYLEYEQAIKALEADNKKLAGQLKEQAETLEGVESLKKDSDALAKIHEAEKKKLIEELVTTTGKDAKIFEGETLEALNKFRALLPTSPPDNSGTIVLSGGADDDRPEGMPEKATVTYYGAKWDKRKPKEYVM